MNRGLLHITREAVHCLLSGGWRMTAGLPSDAAIIGINYDWSTDCVVVIVSHESFIPVPDGCQLPVVGRVTGAQVSDPDSPLILHS